MSESILYFVVDGLNRLKTWLRSYSWIGVQRLVRHSFTCPPFLALEEDHLTAGCAPPQIAAAPRARPAFEL